MHGETLENAAFRFLCFDLYYDFPKILATCNKLTLREKIRVKFTGRAIFSGWYPRVCYIHVYCSEVSLNIPTKQVGLFDDGEPEIGAQWTADFSNGSVLIYKTRYQLSWRNFYI